MWLLINGLKLQTPGHIIHHDFGVLNAEAYFRLAYRITEREWEERKYYKISTALRIF